jgi:hypothetical protein
VAHIVSDDHTTFEDTRMQFLIEWLACSIARKQLVFKPHKDLANKDIDSKLLSELSVRTVGGCLQAAGEGRARVAESHREQKCSQDQHFQQDQRNDRDRRVRRGQLLIPLLYVTRHYHQD